MADNWDKEFEQLIPLPRGGSLVTLRDARDYIAGLSAIEGATAAWQRAANDLARAATDLAWRRFARNTIMKALYGDTPPPQSRKQWREREQ